MKNVIREFLSHFLDGLKYNYPICCVISYCLGARGGENGVIFKNRSLSSAYVPCVIHRKYAITHSVYNALLNRDCLIVAGMNRSESLDKSRDSENIGIKKFERSLGGYIITKDTLSELQRTIKNTRIKINILIM